MKFKSMIFATIFIANGAIAENKSEIYWFKSEWSANGVTNVQAVESESGNRQFWNVSIASSNQGASNLYFMHSLGELDACTSDEDVVQVINVAGRDIQVYGWCKEFADDKVKYVSLTAKTDKGKEFVENAFRKSKDVVKVDFYKYGTIYFSAKGFTKSWRINSAL